MTCTQGQVESVIHSIKRRKHLGYIAESSPQSDPIHAHHTNAALARLLETQWQ
jgi:hypothetical protein